MMQLHDAKNDYKYEGNSGNIFMGEKKKKSVLCLTFCQQCTEECNLTGHL